MNRFEHQCWQCGLVIGAVQPAACPRCGAVLRPPDEQGEPTAPRREQTEPLFTPLLRTVILAVLIVVILAAVGVVAGRLLGR